MKRKLKPWEFKQTINAIEYCRLFLTCVNLGYVFRHATVNAPFCSVDASL